MSERNRVHYVVSMDVDDVDAALRVMDKLFYAIQPIFPDQHTSIALEYSGKWYRIDEDDERNYE